MWVHFAHISFTNRTDRMSKFPPGQGLVLAAGQQVFGRPIAGVWLSVALACAALWMLAAWMPARWGLCGGCLAALHPWFINWSQNYWGGAVAVAAAHLFRHGISVRWRSSLMASGKGVRSARRANGSYASERGFHPSRVPCRGATCSARCTDGNLFIKNPIEKN